MDIPLVLEVLRPTDDWGPQANSDNTYAELVATWRGATVVPTEAEMNTTWATILANRPELKPNPTPAELLLPLQREAAGSLTSNNSPMTIRQRAESLQLFRYVKQLVDANNELRTWVAAFKTAIAASSNLADLKTRVAALTAVPVLVVPTRAEHKVSVIGIINTDDPNG